MQKHMHMHVSALQQTFRHLFKFKGNFTTPHLYHCKSSAYAVVILSLLLLSVACNTPHGERQSSKTPVPDSILAYISQRVNYYNAPDSVLGICYEYLPKAGLLSDSLLLCKGIGTALNIKGKYDEANRYLYDALRMAEQLGKDSLQCMILSELGILQFHLGNADESINMYMQALTFAQKAKDSTSIAVCTNNIGNAYMTVKKDFQSAIPYFEQCFEIGQKIGYSEAAKVAGINLAMIYNELGEPDKAMREVQKVIDSYAPDIYSDYTFAQAYQLKGNYREAIRRFQDIFKKPLNTREFELAILKNMADVYKASGNLDSTVVYLEKSYALRDSLHNRQTDETIHNLKIAYETEKKEMQITTVKGDTCQL